MLNIAQTLADTPKNHYLYTTKHTSIYRLLPLSPSYTRLPDLPRIGLLKS